MFRVDISKKMKFYLKKKHKQFQDYREKMLPKLLKCLLALLIGYTIGETVSLQFTQTREITITNVAVVEAQAETLAPVVSEDKTNKIVESVDESALSVSEMINKAFSDPEMLAIAKAESGLNPKAHNQNRNGTIDTGLFQINSCHGYDEKWLQDPQNNIIAAKEVLRKQGKTAWVVYNNAIKNNKKI
jgi:hypothetical protein